MLCVAFAFTANFAQANSSTHATTEFAAGEITKITIQTNAYSAKSKDVFAAKLPFVKGVKEFTFDERTSRIMVTYDTKKTTPEAIRQEISKLGFNADNVTANAEARAKLPIECKTKPRSCGSGCGSKCGSKK